MLEPQNLQTFLKTTGYEKTVNASTTGIMHIIIELLLCWLHAPGVPASHFLGVTPPCRAGHGQVFLNNVHQVLSSLLLATSKSPAATSSHTTHLGHNMNASCRHQQRKFRERVFQSLTFASVVPVATTVGTQKEPSSERMMNQS